MLKIKSDKDGMTVESSGCTFDLVAEISLAVGYIYEDMLRHDPEMARLYKQSMQRAMGDRSPIWETDDSSSDKFGAIRFHDDPVKASDIAEMIRAGATPEQIAQFCGGAK